MSRLPQVPDIPLDIPESIRLVLEPMKEQLDYFSNTLTIDRLPVTDPLIKGRVWNNAGVLTVSEG